jgi:hypothetical protein
MFSLLRYYGTVTTCTVNCCSNVDIIASHMQHHQGDPICHNTLLPSLFPQTFMATDKRIPKPTIWI